jgi:hypothetical protein
MLEDVLDPSFQLAHAVYTLERTLSNFLARSAVFDIVFWQGQLTLSHCALLIIEQFQGTMSLSLRTGDPEWVVSSRAFARALLLSHLATLDVTVHFFQDLQDAEWLKYRAIRQVLHSAAAQTSSLTLHCSLCLLC